MWNEYEDLTPEERLDKIVEILTEGVLRLIQEKKSLSSVAKKRKTPIPASGKTQKGESKKPLERT